MNIEEFCTKHPYLYHLTDKGNAKLILQNRELLSTKIIAEKAFGSPDLASDFLRSKRETHETLTVDGVEFKIRDQNPISIVVLDRSLTDNWRAPDFIEFLNARVFMWPTLDRLNRHYARYTEENPTIFRFESKSIVNDDALFTKLNSGATRCHPKYDGNAPYRGPKTFLPASEYNLGINSVGEVTFMDSKKLTGKIWISDNPNGPWTII